jgi:hypothetical protein
MNRNSLIIQNPHKNLAINYKGVTHNHTKTVFANIDKLAGFEFCVEDVFFSC